MGKIITRDGSNTENIKFRAGKGKWMSNKIESILENNPGENVHFKTAVIMRNVFLFPQYCHVAKFGIILLKLKSGSLKWQNKIGLVVTSYNWNALFIFGSTANKTHNDGKESNISANHIEAKKTKITDILNGSNGTTKEIRLGNISIERSGKVGHRNGFGWYWRNWNNKVQRHCQRKIKNSCI